MEVIGNSTVASLPPKWATVFDNQGPVWTKRELLTFPNLVPGQYSLPLFLHGFEFDMALITDVEGNVLKYCEDQIYEALEHQMVWIDCSGMQWGTEDASGEWTPSDWQASIYLFTKVENLPNASCVEAQPSAPTEVLLFADYFIDSTADSPHEGWKRLLRMGEDVNVTSRYVSIGPLPECLVESSIVESRGCSRTSGDDCEDARCRNTGQALHIDPGLGRVALSHSTPGELKNRAGGCLHLRARFYDTLGERGVAPAHWMGLTCTSTPHYRPPLPRTNLQLY